jgi:probable addiction module antidote protein
MDQATGSTARKKAQPSSSFLSPARKRANPKISKKRNAIGRITGREGPASVPYEAYLHPRLREDSDYAPAYLTECFNDDYEETFLVALRHVVQARGGIAKVSKAAGLNRESLYKALSRGGNPQVGTLRKILSALKMKVAFVKG